MQLNEDQNDSDYQIQAYRPGEITINHQKYSDSLIVMPDTLITDWRPQSINDIQPEDIQQILDLKPEIILIGTGTKAIIPPEQLREFDCMENGAACRTFVALSSEGRKVAAAFVLNKGD